MDPYLLSLASILPILPWLFLAALTVVIGASNWRATAPVTAPPEPVSVPAAVPAAVRREPPPRLLFTRPETMHGILLSDPDPASVRLFARPSAALAA